MNRLLATLNTPLVASNSHDILFIPAGTMHKSVGPPLLDRAIFVYSSPEVPDGQTKNAADGETPLVGMMDWLCRGRRSLAAAALHSREGKGGGWEDQESKREEQTKRPEGQRRAISLTFTHTFMNDSCLPLLEVFVVDGWCCCRM